LGGGVTETFDEHYPAPFLRFWRTPQMSRLTYERPRVLSLTSDLFTVLSIEWIRSTSQQQSSTSTSSFCLPLRLILLFDGQELSLWRPSLLCCRFDSMEQSAWVCQIS